MDFIKRHYEKIILLGLFLVFIGLMLLVQSVINSTREVNENDLRLPKRMPDYENIDPESPEFYRTKTIHTPTDAEYRSFLDYLYNSVEQLMTGYGRIDLLFFDYTSKYKDGTDYFERERLLEMIYRHQPDILVNDRLAFSKEHVCDFDYYTPEVTVMNQPPSVKGRPVLWESCATMNDHWGYCEGDENYKSLSTLVCGLLGCVSQNGNLLLNVGPKPDGSLPDMTIAKLEELARWFADNGEAVTGCGKAEYAAPFGLCYTRKGKNIYAGVLTAPMGDIILPQLKGKVREITLLKNGSKASLIDFWGFELLKSDDLRIRMRGLAPGDVLKIELL